MSEETVDDYLDQVLAPLALAELREKALCADNAQTLVRVSVLRQELNEQQRIYNEELPDCIGKIPPQLIAEKELRLRKKISELNQQLCQAEQELRTMDEVAVTLENLATASLMARADAYRAIIHWVALWPSDKPREEEPRRSRTRPNSDAGRLVFLTAFGVYHTAQISKERQEGKKTRANILRPATAEETVDGLGGLPDPETFLAGLARSWAGGKYPYHVAEVAPGYCGKMPQPVAEFVIDSEIQTGQED